MIISTIATALIQCTIRTHPGWMIFAGAVFGAVCSSLKVRLDMLIPLLGVDTTLYASNWRFVTAMHAIRSMPAG